MEEFLSVETLKGERESIIRLRSEFGNIISSYNDAYNMLTNDAVVSSFYKSGNFGQEVDTKLKNLYKNLDNVNSITEHLCEQTIKNIDQQIALRSKRI